MEMNYAIKDDQKKFNGALKDFLYLFRISAPPKMTIVN
jgi:hypothetical protein